MRPGALDIEGGKICREERPSPSVANGAATRSPHRADALSQHFIFLLILTSVASQSPRRRLHASHGLWAKIEAAGEVKSRGRGRGMRTGGEAAGKVEAQGKGGHVGYDTTVQAAVADRGGERACVGHRSFLVFSYRLLCLRWNFLSV